MDESNLIFIKVSVLENEFVQLSFLIGEVVERALNIIDTKTITLYRSASKGNREIIEITGTNSECYKFFPNLNYCPCKAYKHQVLKQKEFMCKHVLAAKIASILNKVTVIEKKEEHFNYLIKQIKF